MALHPWLPDLPALSSTTFGLSGSKCRFFVVATFTVSRCLKMRCMKLAGLQHKRSIRHQQIELSKTHLLLCNFSNCLTVSCNCTCAVTAAVLSAPPWVRKLATNQSHKLQACFTAECDASRVPICLRSDFPFTVVFTVMVGQAEGASTSSRCQHTRN